MCRIPDTLTACDVNQPIIQLWGEGRSHCRYSKPVWATKDKHFSCSHPQAGALERCPKEKKEKDA